MILLIILNMLYASMFVLSKFSMQICQPIFITGVRMVLGGIISLIIYCVIDSQWRLKIRKITKTQYLLIGFLTITNGYICNGIEVWGLQYLSVGKTAFIYNLTPFFSALFAYVVFTEYMTWQKWLGLSLGFIGFIPLFIAPENLLDTTSMIGFFSLAEIALLASALASVFAWTSMKWLLQDSSLSLFFVNGLSMFGGGLLCLVHALYAESLPLVDAGSMVQFVKLVCLMAIIKNVGAYNLNSYLLTRYTTTLVAFFGFTASIFATILGMFLCNETVSVYFIVSIISVFIGLLIFYQQELQQGYISK